MILEFAKLFIKEGKVDEFLLEAPKAANVVSKSKGFLGIEFKTSIENPNCVVAMIQWATLEDHTIGFRESDLFQEWRAVIAPFFESAPEVEHFK